MNNDCDVCGAIDVEVLEYDLELLSIPTTIYVCLKCDNNKEN